MKVDREAYAKGVERQLDQLRRDLAPLQSGQMRMGIRRPGEQWQDTTKEAIERNKAAIATYEAILEDVKHNRINKAA